MSLTRTTVNQLRALVNTAGKVVGLVNESDNSVGYLLGATAEQATSLATAQAALGLEAPLNHANYYKWRAAKARVRAGAGRALLLFIGDSMSMGAGGGSGLNKIAGGYAASYVNKVRSLLAAKALPTANGSWFGDQGVAIGTAGAVTPAQYDPRLAPDSKWVTGPDEILAGRFLVFIPGSGQGTLSFTPTDAFDRVTIHYALYSANGTVTVNVDGGASLGTLNAAQVASGIASHTYNVTLGQHTLNIIGQDNGYFAVLGIQCWNSTAPAVDVIQAATYGATAQYFNVSALPWSPYSFLPVLTPDLTVIALSINDINAQTGIAAYTQRIQALITTARLTGDVLLVAGIPTSNPHSTDGTQEGYVAALRDLATLNGCGMLDLTYRWKTYTAANSVGLIDTASGHPSAAGYLDIADALAEVLA